MISKALLTREQAVQTVSSFISMPGAEEYLNRRVAIRKKIEAVWPEITERLAPETWDKSEVRAVELDELDKRVLGEGLRGILGMARANGADYELCCHLADLWKIGKWLRVVTAARKILPFEGESDDEAVLGDEDLEA